MKGMRWYIAWLVFTAALAGCAGVRIRPFPDARLETAEALVSETRVPVALVHGTIIDGTGAAPIPDGTVVFRDGLIKAVGPSESTIIPDGSRTVDLEGAWILPGIINAHVHDAFFEDRAELWAAQGVTTVRDLSCSRNEVVDAVSFRDAARRDPRLTRILTAGALITAPWGYQSGYGLAAGSKRDATGKLAYELGAGVDFVKITLQHPAFYQPGYLKPELATFIVTSAHGKNVPVTAHVGTSGDLEVALDAGVDDIAHVPSDEIPDALLARMVENDIPMEPTFTNREFSRGKQRRTVLSNVRRFVEAGGRVALGCEYIASRRKIGPFAGMPVPEFLMMREAGMTPMEIIVASTRNAAAVCGLANELGTLEAGKAADILVLSRSPLEDLTAFSDVKLVVHGGVVIRK